MRLVLVNPNTSASTTAMMVAVAKATAPDVEIQGLTAQTGEPLITSPAALAVAADAVKALAPELTDRQPDGVIISGFGDPGLERLREILSCPVTGIAEAAMAEAAEDGGRFAVVTTTPDLASSIRDTAEAYGHGSVFAGVALTKSDPVELMSDPVRLKDELLAACRFAVADLGAQTIIIGGGPLALAARNLRSRVEVPVIEPIPAAVRLAMARAQEAARCDCWGGSAAAPGSRRGTRRRSV
jgi:Asp/Glu/hydantoin racemase